MGDPLGRRDLTLAMAAAGAGFWEWTPPDDELRMSDACWAMIGLEPEASPSRGRGWVDRIHPADLEAFHEGVELCHRGQEQAYRLVIRFRAAGGGWRHLLTSGRVEERGEDGRVSRFVGLLLDLQPLKQLELNLQEEYDELADRFSRQGLELEESESRFDRLARDASILLWTAAADGSGDGGGTIWLNPQLSALFGPERDGPLDGRRVLRERIAKLDFPAPASGSAAEDHLEREIVDAEGRQRWILVRGRARETRDGRVLGLVGTVEDVTQRREARLAVLRVNERLETTVAERTAELEKRVGELAERNAELDRFTHIASHDLKSPVRTIRAFTSMVEAELEPESDAAKHLARVSRAGERMSVLLESLLTFASVGRGRLEVQDVDLKKVVDAAMEDLAFEAGGVDVELEVAPLPAIEGDPVLLKQVFQNLLGNAIKYAGGKPPRIGISAEVLPAEGAEAERVRLRVADAGVGFDAAAADSLFEPFTRGSHHGVAGSGVGLSIVKRVVERHGGRVRASRTEEGDLRTRFDLELPRKQPAAGMAAVEVPGVSRG